MGRFEISNALQKFGERNCENIENANYIFKLNKKAITIPKRFK